MTGESRIEWSDGNFAQMSPERGAGVFTEGCTCFEAPAAATDVCVVEWLSNFDRVAVTALDGRSVEGRPDGGVWWTNEGDWLPGFQVQRDDGSTVFVPLSAVETITVDQPASPAGIADTIAHAMGPAWGASGARSSIAAAPSDAHVRITVAVVRPPTAMHEGAGATPRA